MGAVNASIGQVAAGMAGFAMRSAMAVVFMSAALHALRDRDEYAQIVQAYHILPERLVAPVALLLPLLEGAVALALFLPASHFFGGVAALVLLACFSAAIGLNLLRGRRDIACGCGGGLGQTISWSLLLRNMLLLGGLAASLAAHLPPRLSVSAYVGMAGLASFLCALYFAANQLMVNASAMPRTGGARV